MVNKNKMSKKNSNFYIDLKRTYSCYKFSIFELFAVKSNFFYKQLTKIRTPYFKNELEVVNIKESDKVLHIGCGICPTHCILIAENTKARVTGIDNSKKAVELARKHIRKLGLNKKINIRLANGNNFPVEEYTVVFIAINVFPIEGVLKNLSNNLKPGTRILCKSIKEEIKDIIETENFKKYFDILKDITNPKTKSYLLIKK